MVDDLDIWRSAKLLLDTHGRNAEQEAQTKLDVMRVRGDGAGVAVWERILAAIAELRREKPGRNEIIH